MAISKGDRLCLLCCVRSPIPRNPSVCQEDSANSEGCAKCHLPYANIMKHSDWLRLQIEGEKLCALLRQHNYQCLKQPRRLSWTIQKNGNSYTLTWLPEPVTDWNLLPHDTTPTYQTLWNLIQSTLNILRGKNLPNPAQSNIPALNRPWAIVRLLPNDQRRTVTRFYNRQDAEDYIRVLNRSIPAAQFEITFDVSADLS